MVFDQLEYKSIYAEYIIKYLEEQKSIGHNTFYIKYILRDFDRFLSINNYNGENGLSKEIVERWLIKKDTEKYSTRKNRVKAIKSLALFLSNYCGNIYVVNTKAYYDGEKFIPYIFKTKEVKDLFEEISKNKKSYNDKIFELIITILYCCGTRVTETLLLKIEDFDFTNNLLIIRKSKNSKERYVPINDLIHNLLKSFLEQYHRNSSSSNYIFQNPKNNKPLSRVTILNYFHRLCEKLNIYTKEGKLPRIHDLRHTFIIHCMTKIENENKNVNTYLPIISTLVGHENITSTMYYLRFTSERIKTISKIEQNSKVIIPKIGDYNG